MTVQNLYSSLKQGLAKKKASLSDQLAEGRATDFAEYKKIVGRIAGIGDAEEILKDHMRKYHEGDEDEDV